MENIKCKIKRKYVNIENNSTHFTISILFVIYKREEVKIRHAQYWYDKEQLPSLTSTQLGFFDYVHIQQVSGPPMTRKFNEYNILFPRYEEGSIDVKNGKYGMKNQLENPTFKYKQERIFCLSVAKIKSKDGMITGKRCPVLIIQGEIW